MDENNEQNRVGNNENKPDKNQPHDFGKGFGIGAAVSIVWFILTLFAIINNHLATAIIYTLIYFIPVVILYINGKRKLALGFTAALLIPIAIFGGCLLVALS